MLSSRSVMRARVLYHADFEARRRRARALSVARTRFEVRGCSRARPRAFTACYAALLEQAAPLRPSLCRNLSSEITSQPRFSRDACAATTAPAARSRGGDCEAPKPRPPRDPRSKQPRLRRRLRRKLRTKELSPCFRLALSTAPFRKLHARGCGALGVPSPLRGDRRTAVPNDARQPAANRAANRQPPSISVAQSGSTPAQQSTACAAQAPL